MKKDSLIIDGKTFISSRRASEIAAYSKDYVGQLCREGRLVCRRVNRLWWVDESSIKKHAAETLKSNQTSFRSNGSDFRSNASDSIQSSTNSTKSFDSVVAARVAKNITHLAKGGIVTEPTLAVIGEAGPEAVVPITVTRTLFSRKIFAVGFVLVLTLVIGTAFVSVFVLNSSKNFSAESSLANVYSSAPQGQNFIASIWDGLNGIFNNIASILVQRSLSNLGIGQNGSAKIVALNNSSDAANNGPTESATELSSPHAGLVVVPSEGSSTDAKLAQVITNSFSDNVTVTPAANGTTGVITPEFRTVAGHDFLYVLVPVKTASTTQN